MIVLIENQKEYRCVEKNRDIYKRHEKSRDLLVNKPLEELRYADNWENPCYLNIASKHVQAIVRWNLRKAA